METFADKFDQMHDLKKRCKSCVDKMMEAFNNSLKASFNKEVNKSSDNKVYRLISNNNKPENVHDSDCNFY